MKKLKLLIFVVILGAIAWFGVINPILIFRSYETKMENAAKRYYELNSSQLPSGERVKTLKLIDLYNGGLIEGDMFIPYTTKTCQTTDSWVKVRKENGDYKYYTYLECGPLKSKIDHEGPQITLDGKETMKISKGSKYKEPGIKSVVDDNEGTLKTDDVSIKGKVDTSKIGKYEIEYTAFDSLKNKTTVKRTINVVQELSKTIKDNLKNETIYAGNPDNNYIKLSNMIFRIYGLDKNNNIIVVSDEDIANVNFSKLDDWLDYFYDNLNDKTKKSIVKAKYCNMQVDESNLSTTECSSYTDSRNVYIPSIVEVNKADGGIEGTYMRPPSISWVSNKKDNKTAYVTRDTFFFEAVDKTFLDNSVTDNYGVRPMFTIKGNLEIIKGDGTEENPYNIGDTKRAKGGSLLNKREVGEYITDGNDLWRVVKTLKDGTTKVIMVGTVGRHEEDIQCHPGENSNKITYNPNDKASVAYFINNKATQYVDTSNFEIHEIEVPIYKDKIIYKEEKETKKYKAILSAPNMYEMFSAAGDTQASYWLLNTSEKEKTAAAITEIGVPYNEEISVYTTLYVRVVAFYKKGIVISSGDGTVESPYIVR